MPIIGFGGGFGGGGSSYINGVVETSADLPTTVGNPPLDSVYLSKTGSGVWLINRKPAGLYCRTANNGTASDWTYLGAFPEVNADGNWELYNSTDPTKELKFNLSGIATGTTRTITVPNKNVTLDDASDARTPTAHNHAANAITSGVLDNARVNFAAPPAIGSTTRNTGAFTTISASGAISAAAGTAGTPTTLAAALGLQWSGLGGSDLAAVYGTYAGAGKVGIGVGTTGIITEVASFALGGIALNRSVAANNGTLTASAPVLDLAQTWNNAAVTFTGLRFNATNTASSTSSKLLDFQIGGTSVVETSVLGHTTFRRLSSTITYANMIEARRASTLVFGVRDDGAVSAESYYVNANGSGWVGFDQNGFQMRSSARIGWSSDGAAFSTDAAIFRDSAGVLGQRFASTAQGYNIYNTYTSSTNHERLRLAWASNVAIIGTEKGSGGGLARALEFRTDNTARLTIGSAGTVTLNTTLAADAQNISTDTTTGTKIGTGTTQKLGFYGATPAAQQSSTGTDATGFTANGPANTVHADSTFTGNVGTIAYSISDIVKHLKTIGLIAS